MNAAAINILVVDDHSMVIEGMKAILARIPSVALVTTAGNAIEAIAALRTNKVDVAFLDINMPDISGIELCAKVKKEFPAVHVLALSTFKQRSYVSQMIAGGASGYLLKSAGKEEIEEAIHAVVTGRMFLVLISTTMLCKPQPTMSRPRSPAGKRNTKAYCWGMTNNEIAEKIFVSPYTVDTHRKNLLSKFEVNNTAMLIRKAADYRML